MKAILDDASRGRYGREKAVAIRDAAKRSIGSCMPAKSLELQHTIRLIRELDAEIDEIEAAIDQIMEETQSPITTIPGIGTRMGAMILAEIGDFSNFDSPDKILAYAGLSPSTYQSGKMDNCYAHMEKRGSRYLRYALFNATKYVCHWDPTFAAYLAKKARRRKALQCCHTIAQGVGAKQMNGLGEIYESKYGVRTCERVYGTTKEIQEGRGPCYLKTDQISKELEEDLYKAYLNMAPSQTLKWLEGGQGPSEQNVEIQGTEPYIVGGHTASGYWVDNGRATTIRGLYAAGDVCGGAPQKYVTGALVEGKLAAESIIGLLQDEGYKSSAETLYTNQSLKTKEQEIIDTYQTFLNNSESYISIDQVEETMQKVMDEYAGGITSNYQFNETGLKLAKEKIIGLEKVLETLSAKDTDDLLRIYEIKERLTVCLVLIEHLFSRKETRWHGFTENMNYPEASTEFERYVNSYKENGEIKIVFRELVTGDYKPMNFSLIAHPDQI